MSAPHPAHLRVAYALRQTRIANDLWDEAYDCWRDCHPRSRVAAWSRVRTAWRHRQAAYAELRAANAACEAVMADERRVAA